MNTSIRLALLLAITLGWTMTSSAGDLKAAPMQSTSAAAQDNMTPYRTLAADTLAAFKANDTATAKKKARELEVAWDTNEKALQKKNPDVWGQIDKAMDAFIKPIGGKSVDRAKVQAAHDAFIAKLELAVNHDAPKR